MSDRKYRRLLAPRKAEEQATSSDGERDIILAAIEVFGRKGYAGSGLREIADHAQVTAPLINYHFGNKETLYMRCVDAVLGALAETALEAVATDEGIVDAVRRFARAHIDFTAEHPKALRFALGMAYGPAEGQPEMQWSGHYLAIFEWATRRFRRAIDEGELVLRADTNLGMTLRHLFHIVHLEVFSAYERSRFAKQLGQFEEGSDEGVDALMTCKLLPPDAAAEDVVRQFFFGAAASVRDADSNA